MAKDAQIRARVDAELKENAENIIKQLGSTPSAVLNMLYAQIVLRKAIPFDVFIPLEEPKVADETNSVINAPTIVEEANPTASPEPVVVVEAQQVAIPTIESVTLENQEVAEKVKVEPNPPTFVESENVNTMNAPVDANFSKTSMRILLDAQEEAAGMGHEYVASEHILLAITRQSDCAAVHLLAHSGIHRHTLREIITSRLPKFNPVKTNEVFPYTIDAGRVLEHATNVAARLDSRYIESEHLLWGLIRETNGLAARILAAEGVTWDKLRSRATA